MCYYKVRKCLRCRDVAPICAELCEKFDQGSMCLDKNKLINNVSKFNAAKDRVASTMGNGTGMYGDKHNAAAIDLYEILPHKYIYEDGCTACSG